MKEPGRRNPSTRRKANFRARGSGKSEMVIGQPTGSPTLAKSEQLIDEAPPTEVADLVVSAESRGTTTEEQGSASEFAQPVEAPLIAPHGPGAVSVEVTSFDRGGEMSSVEIPPEPPVEHPEPGSMDYRGPTAPDYDKPLLAEFREPLDLEDRESATQVHQGSTAPEPPPHAGAEEPGAVPPTSARAVSPADLNEPPPARDFRSPHEIPLHTPPEFSPRRRIRAQSAGFPIPPPPFYRGEPSKAVADPVPPVDEAVLPAASEPPPVVEPSAVEPPVVAPLAVEPPAVESPAIEPLVVAPLVETPNALPAVPEPPPLATLLPAFQARYSPDYAVPAKRGLPFWAAALLCLACLAAGAVGSQFLPKSLNFGSLGGAGANFRNFVPLDSTRQATASSLTPAEQNEVDAAFAALKARNFDEAARLFTALQATHPAWTAMGIELGRTQLYQGDAPGARATLAKAADKGQMPADANFLLGLLFMNDAAYSDADASFAKATALDPARPDFYYFWGECLRRQGKPLDAIAKFRAALSRNQYETAEGLYRLKLWLSEIQADQENIDGASGQIEKSLAETRPPMEGLFAAAARAIKAGQIPAAADLIRRARQLVEPTVYSVIMKDPSFYQENWRPELAEFFKSTEPASSPTPASTANPPALPAAGASPPALPSPASQ